MAELKTKPTDKSPYDFLNSLDDENQKKDSLALIELFKEASMAEPIMWGDAIIGFGNSSYKNSKGKEFPWFYFGFSPRKGKISLYLYSSNAKYKELIEKLGKYKTGGGCLYIKRLTDINIEVLKNLLNLAMERLNQSNLSLN